MTRPCKEENAICRKLDTDMNYYWNLRLLYNVSSLTCRGCFSMNGRCGRDERWKEEGSQRSFAMERWPLRGQILTAPHTAVNLKVQGLCLLLGSEGKQDSKIQIMSWREGKEDIHRRINWSNKVDIITFFYRKNL